MKGIKLISMSAEFCAPCRNTRSYVEDKYGKETIGYQWVDVENIAAEKEEIQSLYQLLQPRSIPLLAVVDFNNMEVVEKWMGFNPKAIDSYVQKYKSNSSEEE